MAMTKINNCPFCGSTAYTWEPPSFPGCWYAECTDEKGGCGALMQGDTDSEENAIKIWNDRVDREKNMDGIEPCPWCGEYPKVEHMDADIWANEGFMIEADESTEKILYYIGCKTKPGNESGKCPVTPEFWANTEEKAIALWNGEEEAWNEIDKGK